jgi:uncharacterized membrane protein
MKLDVTAEAVVDRSREAVFAFMADPANDPKWIVNLRSARLLGDGPIAEGARVERLAHFLGRRIEYVLEIVGLDPGARLEMRSVKAPFPMHITYTFEDAAAGGTTVRNRVAGEVGGFFAAFGPLMPRMVRRNVQRDLDRLKNVLEPEIS